MHYYMGFDDSDSDIEDEAQIRYGSHDEDYELGDVEVAIMAVIEAVEKETARALYFERLVQRLVEATR